MNRSRLRTWALVLSAALGLLPLAASAAWPDKPIKLVVPFPPGGGVDVMARLFSTKLAALLGQPVVIDNKPGADTQIGTAVVGQAAPDGYTFGLLTSAFSVNKALYPNLTYDAAKDFTPVAGVLTSPFYLVAWPGMEPQDIRSMLAYAKKNPGKLNYSSSSGDGFLAAELMNKSAGIDAVHVRYKGTPPSVLAVMSGEVSYSFFTLLGIKAHVDSGKLRVLGVTSARRTPHMPQVPTIAESGVPGYEMTPWFGFLAPAGLPPEITARMNAVINQIIEMPDVKAKIDSLGATPLKQTPQEFSAFLNGEFTKYGALVRDNKLRAD
ncbi:MAG TPA: tripartite tricarboxylate transporter substrate binding protein [Ramlibacter sp.]|nr:tripartite tricarboxylate transporter substrate binding protein [Ramlibacter sp.]